MNDVATKGNRTGAKDGLGNPGKWSLCAPDQRAEQIQFQTWEEFCGEVRNRPQALTLFRGQRDSGWRIWSKWERILHEGNSALPRTTELRDRYLDRFHDAIIGTPGFDTNKLGSRREWWAFARHFGLITPLVDWTESPYVAAYFAYSDAVRNDGLLNYQTAHPLPMYFTDKSTERVSIHALTVELTWWNQDPRHNDEDQDRKPFEVFRLASDVMHRQKAQRGWYSWLKDGTHIDVESFLAAEGKSDALKCYSLPKSIFNAVLSDLRDMNIHAASLFPDALGAAQYANIDYAFHQGGGFDPSHLEQIGAIEPQVVVSVPNNAHWSDLWP